MLRRLTIVSALMAVAFGGSAQACTGIRLTAKDGTVVVARTLEFGLDLKSNIVVIPKGTSFTGTLPNNAKGIAYSSHYGFVGANAFDLPIVVDGVNDQGLYIGEFFFPGYAQYAVVTPQNASKAMAGYEYSDWILANFASVAEVKAAFDHVALAPTALPQMGMAPPVHFRIVDKTGAAVVVEPIGGTLKIDDDPFGVLTNAPTFDWHLTNLGNYVGLTPMIKPSVKLDGYQVASFGQGSGFYGLPGDFTPPSRFVRAVAFQQTAAQPSTAVAAVQQVFHILNNFDIPVGAVRDKVENQVVDEYTLWTSAEDLQNVRFYFKTFQDQTLRSVDVRKALSAAGGKIQYLPMESSGQTPILPVGS